MANDPTAPRRRSTFRVLGTLFLVVVGGLATVGACLSAYVSSTPPRTLEVLRSELSVRVPKFYPLPSMGADGAGRTFGVWVTLEDDGSATALLARDPRSGAMLPWRAEMRVADTTGVYRDGPSGNTYNRDGTPIFGPVVRGLDSYDVRVNGPRIVVDLSRVRLGTCLNAAENNCSRPDAPVYRDRPPPAARPPGSF